MNALRLFFTPLPYPYPEDIVDDSLVWGQIRVVVEDSEIAVQTIFDWQWDIVPLVDWIIDNQAIWYEEEVPDVLASFTTNSIAQTLTRFYKVTNLYDDESDLPIETYEIVHDYGYNHNLFVGLHGVDTKAVYIGRYKGVIEASMDEGSNTMRYAIDLGVLVNDAQRIKRQFKS